MILKNCSNDLSGFLFILIIQYISAAEKPIGKIKELGTVNNKNAALLS